MDNINLSPANQSYINKNINAQNITISQNEPKLNPSPKQDTIELSTKKSTKNKKVALGIAGALIVATGIIAGILTNKKINTSKINQLAEFIEFKPAQNMDEAIEFAKKNFGIEKFDFGEDLELANWANEGLANINNKAKGKIHMPKSLCLDKNMQNDVAGFCNVNGDISINPNDFNYEHNMEAPNIIFKCFEEGGIVDNGCIVSKDSLLELVKMYKFKKANPDYQFSRMEALKLERLAQDVLVFKTHPMEVLQAISQDEIFAKTCKSQGIEINLEELSKLSKEQQSDFISNIFTKLALTNLKNVSLYPKGHISEFDTLYHEMGHLQHFKNTSFFSQVFGKLSDKPKQIAKFTNNPTTQKIASKVSWYAQTQPNEFVAEVYAKLCNGVKFDNETMELYKKLGGVLI